MRTNADVIGVALARGNVTTVTTGLYTDSVMSDFYNEAHRWACAYKKWPWTEGRYSTTWTGLEETVYPEGWRSDGIRYMEIGGKELDKTNFYDYKRYREDSSSGADRIYSDHFRILFVNPNSDDVSGTMTVYGQYIPSLADHTAAAAATQFADSEDNGNEAIAETVLSYMKEREKRFDESNAHKENAMRILDAIWKSVGEEQPGYKPKDSSLFERVDVLHGDYYSDVLKRDQFY